MISQLAHELKSLSEYELLKINEIEAWLRRALEEKMPKPCYITADDFFQAQQTNNQITSILKRARRALILPKAVISIDSQSYMNESEQIDLIEEIDELLKEMI